MLCPVATVVADDHHQVQTFGYGSGQLAKTAKHEAAIAGHEQGWPISGRSGGSYCGGLADANGRETVAVNIRARIRYGNYVPEGKHEATGTGDKHSILGQRLFHCEGHLVKIDGSV